MSNPKCTYTFRMDAFADVVAESKEEAWQLLGNVPDNEWAMDLDYPELIEITENDDD